MVVKVLQRLGGSKISSRGLGESPVERGLGGGQEDLAHQRDGHRTELLVSKELRYITARLVEVAHCKHAVLEELVRPDKLPLRVVAWFELAAARPEVSQMNAVLDAGHGDATQFMDLEAAAHSDISLLRRITGYVKVAPLLAAGRDELLEDGQGIHACLLEHLPCEVGGIGFHGFEDEDREVAARLRGLDVNDQTTLCAFYINENTQGVAPKPAGYPGCCGYDLGVLKVLPQSQRGTQGVVDMTSGYSGCCSKANGVPRVSWIWHRGTWYTF